MSLMDDLMVELPRTRRTARAIGSKLYFTGVPCKNGHLSRRYSAGGSCVRCQCDAADLARRTHPDKSREYSRTFRNKNPEKMRTSVMDWIARNPDRWRAIQQRRRAKLKDVRSTFSSADWRELVMRSARCHWCRKPFGNRVKPTHDHVIPVSRGGPNTLDNSVCACRSCNSRKNNKLVNPATGQGILL